MANWEKRGALGGLRYFAVAAISHGGRKLTGERLDPEVHRPALSHDRGQSAPLAQAARAERPLKPTRGCKNQREDSWTLPGRMGDNPMVWLIQVNGLIVDARQVSREIQEEAFRRGLIPYLP